MPKALADRNHTYHRVVGDGKPAPPTVGAMWNARAVRWRGAERGFPPNFAEISAAGHFEHLHTMVAPHYGEPTGVRAAIRVDWLLWWPAG